MICDTTLQAKPLANTDLNVFRLVVVEVGVAFPSGIKIEIIRDIRRLELNHSVSDTILLSSNSAVHLGRLPYGTNTDISVESHCAVPREATHPTARAIISQLETRQAVGIRIVLIRAAEIMKGL